MRSSLDRVGSLAVFLFMVKTTAALSHRAHTFFPLHWGPHMATAITIGTISFGAMDTSSQGWCRQGPHAHLVLD